MIAYLEDLAERADAVGWTSENRKLEVTLSAEKRELTFECQFEEPPDYDPEAGPLEDEAWVVVDQCDVRIEAILEVIARHQATLNRPTWAAFVGDLLETGAHLETENGDAISSVDEADLAVSKLEFEEL